MVMADSQLYFTIDRVSQNGENMKLMLSERSQNDAKLK